VAAPPPGPAASRRRRRAVVPDRSYLDRVDADPFVVGWPPPPAGVLWWQLRERLPLVARFAPGDVVDRTRQVRRLARTDRYGGLREAAVARDAITEAERDRIEAGVEGALTARRDERDRIDGALETHPPIGER
jgi:hypothetical protein